MYFIGMGAVYTGGPENSMDMSSRRILTPLDNEALSRYFTARAEASPEVRAKMEAAFNKALDEGERPLVCAERALKTP